MLLKESTVWSMEHLNRYINDKFRKTKGLPRDWVFTTFTVSLALSWKSVYILPVGWARHMAFHESLEHL